HPTVSEVIRKFNKESGIYAINNGVSDMRELTDPANINNDSVQLALKMYAYRVKKYIGSYTASMNGVDAIVFTAGIGEYTPELRELILKDMEFFGVKLDNEKNYNAPRGDNFIISAEDSKVKVCIIPTNEELVIAKQTEQLVK
ncbi:MAG: acetate kinase, partial [Clostridia bacterium]|nr:acetate kinase [Clostridia bacterium]